MELRRNPIARLDGLDREAFQAMMASEPFAIIQARITAELHRAEEACVRSDADLDLRRAQGAVTALRAVLELPMRIFQERAK